MKKMIFGLLLGLTSLHSALASTLQQSDASLIGEKASKNAQLLKNLLMQNQQTINALMSEVQHLTSSQQKNTKPTVAVKPGKDLSPMDREAMNSPIFLPGGAPMPEGYSDKTQQQQTGIPTPPEKPTDKADTEIKTPDTSTSDNSSNSSNSTNPYNNNYNGGGYYPSSSTKFQATFTAVNSSAYSYGIAKERNTFINPLTNATSSNAISLKITGNASGSNSTYNSIKFCKTTFTSCNSALNMSNNTTNITSDQLVGGNSSYALTGLTIGSSTANYQIARLYAQITNSSSTTTNISFSFPVSSCSSTDNGDLSCSLSTSGTTVSVSSN